MDNFVTSLHLLNDGPSFVTTDLSQFFLINEITVDTICNKIPNPIFASLPNIYQHPENLKYSHKTANRKILNKMLLSTNLLPDSNIVFQYPTKRKTEFTFSAGTSLYMVLEHFMPEYSFYHSCLFLVRNNPANGKKLLLRPSSLPIGIYDIPGCIWTIELIHVPEKFRFEEEYTVKILTDWITARKMQRIKEGFAINSAYDSLIEQAKKISNWKELDNYLGRIETDKTRIRKYRASNFKIYVDWKKSVSIKIGSNTFCSLDITTTRFTKKGDKYELFLKDLDSPISMSKKDANKIEEFLNLSVIPREAEKNPTNSFSIAFPDRESRLTCIPQVTRESRIMNIEQKDVKRIIERERKNYKSSKKFGAE